MKRSCRWLVAIVLSGLIGAAQAQAQEVDSRWRLRIMDLHKEVKVDAIIRFKNEAADSCIDGNWKRIVVESRVAGDDAFFPLSGPLAYTVENGTLKLGRTAVCDGYLFMSGKPGGSTISGDYYSLGWGVNALGSFLLEKLDPQHAPSRDGSAPYESVAAPWNRHAA